jgi:sensor histidine kinase regulating citrate/malate metabolism
MNNDIIMKEPKKMKQGRSKQLKLSIFIFLIFMLLLTVVNTSYYFTTKNALIKQQQEKSEIIAHYISTSIQLSRQSEKIVEDLIGTNLRSVALVAQAHLDPNIEKVTNDQLAKISTLTGVDHITLMKRDGDDIIGYKSSDPSEINMSTKGWRGYWFQAFNQLLDNKKVVVPVGQSLPNYWSGPINTSQTNPDSIDKWGYYYDGSTNYIIDPFVHDTSYKKHQKETGVDALISNIISDHVNQNGIDEISVFNPPIFLGQQEQYKKDGVVWYSDRKVLFGTNNLQAPEDKNYVDTAMKTHNSSSYEKSINNKPYLVSFIPLNLDFPVVIKISSDLSVINKTVNDQLFYFIVILVSLSIVCFGIIAFTIRVVNRSKEQAVQSVQDIYIGNIDTLFQAIKEQRHDYNSHVNTIHSLIVLGELDELRKYTEEIIGDAVAINDIMNISNPAICALVQAKSAQAVDKKIVFEHEMDNMEELSNSTVKSIDIVKIISNLLDNAFEATTSDNNPHERLVKIESTISDGQLNISVFNTGMPIPKGYEETIFKPGFSTKGREKNLGLGLSIVKKMVNKYNGNIKVYRLENGTQFDFQLLL